jgi:hypothetical protein
MPLAVPDSTSKKSTETNSNPKKTRGWIVHQHPDETSEGCGSHARGVLYPIIHIAQANGLEPVFSTKDAFGNNTARDYSKLDVTSFLNLRHDFPENKSTKYHTLTVNTWSDRTIGSACGDGRILATLLGDYLEQLDKENYDDIELEYIIYLVGAIRYMDPTPEVYQFLQDNSSRWSVDKTTNQNDLKRRKLRVTAHVRVPEDFCPQQWKDDNHISKLFPALKKLKQLMSYREDDNVEKDLELSIYTEERFSKEDEALLKEYYPLANVYRGNSDTLLSDVKALSSADILIPSSSHLSAMAGYLAHGLIVLSDPSRWDYFQPHKELGCHIVDMMDLDDAVDIWRQEDIICTKRKKNSSDDDNNSNSDSNTGRLEEHPFSDTPANSRNLCA